MKRVFLILLILLFIRVPLVDGSPKEEKNSSAGGSVPILVYHRLGPVASDGMTVTTSLFKSHLEYLHDRAYSVTPLREFLDKFRKGIPLPPRSVAITVDDGHLSVYTEALPLIKRYRVPVTLFIYPSAISNASYCMTWSQLKELKGTGLFDIQSHTYWHPNFKKEKERLSPGEYEKFVEMQFRKSKEKLEKEFQSAVDLLAWPFGIYDPWLMAKAAKCGYVAAFTIEGHPARLTDRMMALPRYLMTDAFRGRVWEKTINGGGPR